LILVAAPAILLLTKGDIPLQQRGIRKNSARLNPYPEGMLAMRLLSKIAAALLAASPVALAAAEPVAPPKIPVQILGPAAEEAWTIKPPAYSVSGEPAIVVSAAPGVTLESKAPHAAPGEYFFAFRLKPETGKSSSIRIQLASAARPDKTQQALNFSASLTGGLKYVSHSASVTGGKPPAAQNGSQYVAAVTDRSLGWSEDLRRIIETQMAAAPKPEAMLHTVRSTVEKGRFRTWLNGRFVSELILEPDMDPAGLVKIFLAPNSELVSVRMRPLPPVSDRFEPLSIAGNLTGATLAGKKVDHGSLPGARAADKPAGDEFPARISDVDGVPFQFPEPAAGGNDHLDVATSWTRFGALPGYISSMFGSFGGRWISANRLDPSRHCQLVPRGRYKALHLVAVADDRPDHVPIVSAQFYRPDAGHPFNFSATIPKMNGDAGTAKPLPIKLADGTAAKLFHVTIPLDPDAFSWFTDLDRIGLEITKEVRYYRGYPDPLEYSWHGGGLPSSVRIYAMTLERADVDIDIEPEQFGHVWTAPAKPSYALRLRNATGIAGKAKLVVETKSHDGQDVTRQELEAALPADASPVNVPVSLKPTRFGLHELSITLGLGDSTSTYRRTFAHLHADTREQAVWEEGRGSVFGFWPWGGGHVTPPADKEISVMGAAGAETSTRNYSQGPPEVTALAQKYRFMGESAFHGGVMYLNGFYKGYTNAPTFDPAKPEETAQALITAMKKNEAKPGPVSKPTYIPFFAEPQIGTITTGIWPSYYGEDYQLSEAEQRTLADMKAKFVLGARAIRKEWPDYKLLMPYGDPMNTAIFLKFAPETRELIDGCALDLPGFERMPEQQINQVVLNRLYPIMKEIKQYKPDPYLVLVEGFCVGSKDIDTGEQGQAEITMRDFLVLMGYGVTRFEAPNSPFDCANYWGENHYGAGWNTRLPLAMPKLAYVCYATLTRHLNRANFTKYVPTGSTSTYCEQFKHYKTGKLIHVLWTIRGKRPVTVKVPAGTTLELYDPNDNVTRLVEKNGVVTFTVDQLPQYLEGLTADAEITLGESDHSDARPAAVSRKLSNFGDGSWTVVDRPDDEYQKNKPLQIERFLGKMTAKTVEAPATQGAKALAIHLEQQEKDRGVMPYFTTLEPKGPIEIPGKADHLGLWVEASSDWGRFVYVVRDANGEKWISVGTKEDWNNDDIHCYSAFCFDGRRYMRFPLPASLPYDSYREHGTSWWGSYGGDGIVDLPLKLEKVIIERRPKVIYGNDLIAAKADDVLLGDLYAEYASPADQTEEAVRLSKLRMPVPHDAPALGNPIADLAATGVGPPTKVIKVADPLHMYDGTRCHVHFDPVAGAKSYDIWVSPYADGRGAIQLGKAWTESGQLLQGLRPDIDFHLFVVYTDRDGKPSKPSAPLAFKLKDRFGYK
jgi:hypothetical protein